MKIFQNKNKRGFQSTIFQKKNRKGWIEIVEAFVAVLLIAGVLLIVINKGYLQKTDISEKVYQAQISILREIQTDSDLRTKISTAPEPLPISWLETPDRFPADVKNKIIARTPGYLNCVGKICDVDTACMLSESEGAGKDIYSQSILISATLVQGEVYRKLNLFCWPK